jgi:hypothetical protein
MQKVLLAINGISPSRKVFNYAVQLCRRLKAELCVLQVIEPRRYGECFKAIRGKACRAKHFLEGSMTAVTFAEAGEHETARDVMVEAGKNMNALLPETKKAGVLCHVTTKKSGWPSNEIVRYAMEHRDVVLTVYDGAGAANEGSKSLTKEQDVAVEIGQHLPTPLVTMHA